MEHLLKDAYKQLSIDIDTIPEIRLEGITADSRKVNSGWIFVAERGVNVDGHDYIDRAIDSGAVAIVCEYIPELLKSRNDIYWLLVDDSAEALGRLASWWYNFPSQKLTLVGVTGTNGKTTIATLLYEIANYLGEKSGLISTVVNKIYTREIPSTHTTPDILTTNRLLSEMVECGCTFCAMEVSSHACTQKRIASLQFAGGIFTNLTRDHLDYHGTFEHYLKAKKSFFDTLSSKSFALTNLDDRHGEVMLQNTKAKKYSYSIHRMADFHSRLIEDRIDGMLMDFGGLEVETSFVGAFNASNLTAIYGASILVGWDKDEVLKAISNMHPVDGRMQTLHGPNDVTVVVDYAHTPDALSNVLSTLTEVKGAKRIITVFGAGGDRDKGKRPLMGAEVAKRSDITIVTSDNPRHEIPEEIATQIIEGIPNDTKTLLIRDLDRASAIKRSISLAKQGDIILIAGKGHETYQIIGDTKHHFDDREVVKEAFAEMTE